MNLDEFAQQLQNAHQRMFKLQERADEFPRQEKQLLLKAFDEFQIGLEELQVAEEELRQQNEELAASRMAVEAERQRYQDLFEFAPDGYLVTNAAGVILEANRAASTLLKVSPNFLASKPMFIFIAEDERQIFRTKLNALQQVQRVQEWAVRLCPRYGQPFDAVLAMTAVRNWEGELIAVRWLLRDVTERKQAEAALRCHAQREQALNQFTAAISSSLDLKTICATATKEISQLFDVDHVEIQEYLPGSQIWSTVSNYQQRPNLPRSLSVVSDAENKSRQNLKQFEVAQIDYPNTVEAETATIDSGSRLLVPLHFQDELWGSFYLIISDRCHQWSDSEQELVRAIATHLANAIQQGHLYQQLKALNAELERQSRERTAEMQQKIQELEQLNILKDDFLSTVSHELRTPMTNMQMSIKMLRTSPSPERQQRYLEILQAECNRETELINDLLDLQRLEVEPHPIALGEEIHLQDWLPKILEPFRSRAVDRKHSFAVDLPPDLPPLLSNYVGLERILAELLNNALKYTPADGKIMLCVRHLDCELPIKTFTISNQAEIPAAALSHVFEKFYRVPNADQWKQGGTGLGLALVHKLVEQLRGSIQVESSGGWTSFTVKLPS